MRTTTATDLDSQAEGFAKEILELLNATLPGDHSVSIEPQGTAYVLHTASDGGGSPGHIPLRIRERSEPIATFFLSMSLRADRTGRYLAVSQSKFVLYGTDRRPLVRLEFLDDANRAPCCHWQFHGQSLPFEQLLRATRAKGARSLSRLHFPVGGVRMRPGIEDFLQFLIQECRFEPVPGWRKAIEKSRTDWRLRQTRVIVRDAPRTAAKALGEALGVRVLRLARLSKSTDEVPLKFSNW